MSATTPTFGALVPHATCHDCGARRPLTDMQRTYKSGHELWWCSPVGQEDTCYDLHINHEYLDRWSR